MESVVVPKGKSWQGSWATVKDACDFLNDFFHIENDRAVQNLTTGRQGVFQVGAPSRGAARRYFFDIPPT